MLSKLTLPSALLTDLTGVWRRDLYETPLGRDTESPVYWVQANTLYGDLRDEPQGIIAFSGTLEHNAGVFTWNMPLLSFDLPEFPDAGRLYWDNGDLVEIGVHREYREIWRRVGEVEIGDFALQLENQKGSCATVLRVSGFQFAMIGVSDIPGATAVLRGNCTRFGHVERMVGPAGPLEKVLCATTPETVPKGWSVIRSELDLQ